MHYRWGEIEIKVCEISNFLKLVVVRMNTSCSHVALVSSDFCIKDRQLNIAGIKFLDPRTELVHLNFE